MKVIRILALFLACLCLSLNLPFSFKKELFTTGQYASFESDFNDHKEMPQPLIDLLLAAPTATIFESISSDYDQSVFPGLAGHVNRYCFYHLCDIPPPQSLT